MGVPGWAFALLTYFPGATPEVAREALAPLRRDVVGKGGVVIVQESVEYGRASDMLVNPDDAMFGVKRQAFLH